MKRKWNEPCAIKYPLGWVVVGSVKELSTNSLFCITRKVNVFRMDGVIDEDVDNFRKIMLNDQSGKVKEGIKFVNFHVEVRLLWKKGLPTKPPNNRKEAIRAMKSREKQQKRDKHMELFNDQINALEENEFIQEVKTTDNEEGFCLNIRGVLKTFDDIATSVESDENVYHEGSRRTLAPILHDGLCIIGVSRIEWKVINTCIDCRISNRPAMLQQMGIFLDLCRAIRLEFMIYVVEEKDSHQKSSFQRYRGVWKAVIVTKTYPGEDGLVSKVRIRASTAECDRPISKLCLLATGRELEEDSILKKKLEERLSV
ncbi:unnamed protein product [Lepeophtheirus salmonis]|uniref:(salmon louse) hypothetical protein n=1 Tax=Lepeophtheirus salmonis TaxID=72036 RepID=A0A7R8HCA9_LEPSM|nr:unnamed protein product [Lepeophtheirus salmonis]CAF3004490.1 unnamed protein product [Lepeophtheirus salmonis]